MDTLRNQLQKLGRAALNPKQQEVFNKNVQVFLGEGAGGGESKAAQHRYTRAQTFLRRIKREEAPEIFVLCCAGLAPSAIASIKDDQREAFLADLDNLKKEIPHWFCEYALQLLEAHHIRKRPLEDDTEPLGHGAADDDGGNKPEHKRQRRVGPESRGLDSECAARQPSSEGETQDIFEKFVNLDRDQMRQLYIRMGAVLKLECDARSGQSSTRADS
ncbi:hypothetical protein GE09DRAFT_575918 [Coniochaeta sp. 2T2.1]|nr:hypothetical protein GE09DRAFT_575918 [Coniochaeta sp. 2T2.1]